MKKQVLLMITFVLCGVFAAWAQNNDKISYQAVVRDSENRLVYNTELQVTVSLANSATGTAVYSERHTVTSNANGLISLLIGDGQDRQGNWGDVRWNTAWVTATVRSADGQTQIAEHHLPLSAVPYALYADYADSVNLNVMQNYLDEHHYVTEDELPAAQVNSDWTETNPDTASFIKNKPDLSVYATKDTLSYYTTSNDVDTLLGDYVTKSKLDDTLGHYVLNTDFTDFTDEVGQNFTKMTNRMDTMLTHVCDSVNDCMHGWISDSTRMVIDSLNAYYDTTHMKTAIHDTANVLRDLMGDAANNATITIKKNNVEVDHFTLNQEADKAINITVPTTVAELTDAANYVTNAKLNDTLNKYTTTNKVDTLLGAYYDTTSTKTVIHDTAQAIRSLIPIVPTNVSAFTNDAGYLTEHQSLEGYVTTVQMNDQHYLTSDSTVITTMQTNITNLQNGIKKNALCDSVNDCVTAIAKSVAKDTANSLRAAIHDSLSSYKIKNCDDVTTCVNTALADGNSATNHAIDSIAGNVIHDSIKTNIQTNISNTIHDSIVNKISKQIHDSIGNGMLTITYGSQPPVTFTANQKTPSTISIPAPTVPNNGQITITRNNAAITNGTFSVDQSANQTIDIEVPTKLSQMTNDGGVYAKRDSVNFFTDNNSFTGTVTAPNGFVIKGDNATNETNCGNIVVNACDLWAVFDSLNRRMQALENALTTTQQELDALKGTTPPTVSVNLSEVQYTSMKATATASGNGANITSYKFCISTNSDMSDATCFTSATNEYTFTSLEPYTTYYVTVDATNMAGTTTSYVVSQRTAIHAPTGTFSLQSIAPKGFSVTVNNLNFKEPAAGTVQICYKKNDGTCPTDFSSYFTCDAVLNLTSNTIDTTRKLINIDEEAGVGYCVIVKLTNGDSTTILGPSTVNTGAAISLNITHDPEMLDCLKDGDSVSVDFAAIVTIENEDVSDNYNYEWSDGTRTVQGNHALIRFKTTGEKTITCTATHKTEGYSVIGARLLTISPAPAFDIAITDLTVTLQLGQNVALDSIAWGDGKGKKNPTNGTAYTYESANIYTMTVFSLAGCTVDTPVTVNYGIVQGSHTPCNVISAHTNTSMYTSTTGGLETTDDNGKVIMVQDQDEHEYFVTQIGTGSSAQCWMAENLRSKKYSSSLTGTPTLIALPSTYNNANAYYAYPNNNNVNEESYGLLYNWTAAMGGSTLEGSQGICPDGWRMPKKSDIDILISSSEATLAAGKLAGGAIGTWTEPESPSTAVPGNYSYTERNSSGFSVLPAGAADMNNITRFGTEAFIWTSTFQNYESTGGLPSYYYLDLIYDYDQAKCHDYVGVSNSLSVRCIRDAEGGIPVSNPTVTTSSATIGADGVTMNGDVSANGNTISEKGFEWKIVNEAVNTVQVTGNSFTYLLTFANLSANTYNYRAYVKTNGSTYYGEWEEFVITPPSLPFTCGISKMIDASGNSYETVSIGDQCWTKTNLRTTKKRNGDDLSLGGAMSSETVAYYFKPTSSSEWKVTSDFGGSEVVPFNSYNDSVFGYYYNWPAAAGQGYNSICPEGWHVPSIDDWNTLISSLSSSTNYYACDNDPDHIAKALSYESFWKTTAEDCTPGNDMESNNASDFSAIAAGYHNTDYTNFGFYDAGYVADFWSASQYDYFGDGDYVGNYVRILWQQSFVDVSWYWKDTGKSVRCVRDAESGGGGAVTPPTPSEFTCGTSTVSDADGNTYSTVQIGTGSAAQCWMAENLKSTHYSNGTTEITGKYFPNNSESNVATYGYLYDWNAVMNGSTSEGAQGICPTGWHVPSSTEISALSSVTIDFLPGIYSSGFWQFNQTARFWSSTEMEYDDEAAWYFNKISSNSTNALANDEKTVGLSVRCVRDE